MGILKKIFGKKENKNEVINKRNYYEIIYTDSLVYDVSDEIPSIEDMQNKYAYSTMQNDLTNGFYAWVSRKKEVDIELLPNHLSDRLKRRRVTKLSTELFPVILLDGEGWSITINFDMYGRLKDYSESLHN